MDSFWLLHVPLIEEALPGVLDDQLDGLKIKLQELGVESADDLVLITEEDLEGLLPPIKKRKLLKLWKSKGQNLPSESASCVAVAEVSQLPGTSQEFSDWSVTYNIPWEKLPKDLVTCAKKGERPNPRDRREMVRIIIDDVMQTLKKIPKRKELRNIARKIVKKYPESLADVINGQMIGDGSASLLQQFESRKENNTRSMGSGNPAKQNSSEKEGETLAKKKRKREVNSFGCINYQPDFPEDVTLADQEEKKLRLQQMYEEATWKLAEIEELMAAATYTLQRKNLIEATCIEAVLKDWPFLIEEQWLLGHFNSLTGIDLGAKLHDEFVSKGSRLVKFLKTKKTPANLVKAVGEINNPSAAVRSVPKLLCLYFKEDVSALIHHYDDMATKEDVEADVSLPTTPCIAILGEQIFLCIDKKVVHGHLTSVEKGIAMVFASFYVFNIVYPLTASSTLDFIQRVFVGINPPQGSKALKGRKSGGEVSNKVLSLANDLTIFESDWVMSEP